jgi:antitoxin FitA
VSNLAGELAFCRNQQQNDGISKSITIRDVPLETRDELAARAARSGRSLQEYLRGELIEIARRPDPEALLARVRERKEYAESRLPRERILSHRAADRR